MVTATDEAVSKLNLRLKDGLLLKLEKTTQSNQQETIVRLKNMLPANTIGHEIGKSLQMILVKGN